MKNLIFFFLLVPFLGMSQYTLTIVAVGINSSEGNIGVGVYNTKNTFLKDGKTFDGAFEKNTDGNTTITITDLPEGTYAVSIFHDENSNEELDTNFIGIPKEDVAFSKGKMRTFGPPSFEECSFKLTSDFEIQIPF